jgi:hypothetical protein
MLLLMLVFSGFIVVAGLIDYLTLVFKQCGRRKLNLGGNP